MRKRILWFIKIEFEQILYSFFKIIFEVNIVVEQ